MYNATFKTRVSRNLPVQLQAPCNIREPVDSDGILSEDRAHAVLLWKWLIGVNYPNVRPVCIVC